VGYRDEWLTHAGLGSRHYEVVVHAFDKNLPKEPVRLLEAGVENGGSLEVWKKILPEGSEVVGVDCNPLCATLGLDVRVGDVTDDGWLRGQFRGEWFDIIVDSTGTMTANLWPFLTLGGRMFLEGYDTERVIELVRDVAEDRDSWLPGEEIMRVEVFPHIVVIEKRNPRVVPYLQITVGNFYDVVPEPELLAQGMKRVVV
jgi:hypothetical protein